MGNVCVKPWPAFCHFSSRATFLSQRDMHMDFRKSYALDSRAARHRFTVAVIVLISVALRIALAAEGGQSYFTDERTFEYGAQLYRGLVTGNGREVIYVLTVPTHAVFI